MNKSLIQWINGTLLTIAIFGLTACGGGADEAPVGNAETTAAVVEEKLDVSETKAVEEGGTATAASASTVDKEIVAIYQRSCISCHISGAAGAPRSHDEAAWAPKMAKGMNALIASVNEGLNAMPPKGMCFDCNDEQYKALIEFMAGPKPD